MTHDQIYKDKHLQNYLQMKLNYILCGPNRKNIPLDSLVGFILHE